MANRKKKEEQNKRNKNNGKLIFFCFIYISGENWKYQITIPQEFNLHFASQNNNSSIMSSYSPIRRNSQPILDRSVDKIERNVVFVDRITKNGHGGRVIRLDIINKILGNEP